MTPILNILTVFTAVFIVCVLFITFVVLFARFTQGQHEGRIAAREEAIRRQVDREMKPMWDDLRRMQEESPGRAFAALLLSVAKADRHLTAIEERQIVESVQTLFPGRWPQGRVTNWLTGDATDAPASYAERIPRELWPQAWELIEKVSRADGRQTPAEKRRLNEIRDVLLAGHDA